MIPINIKSIRTRLKSRWNIEPKPPTRTPKFFARRDSTLIHIQVDLFRPYHNLSPGPLIINSPLTCGFHFFFYICFASLFCLMWLLTWLAHFYGIASGELEKMMTETGWPEEDFAKPHSHVGVANNGIEIVFHWWWPNSNQIDQEKKKSLVRSSRQQIFCVPVYWRNHKMKENL